jgi:hypothetical protein
MDYLLRDSHHVGVAYGRFDHYRLVDTLRILQIAPSGEGDDSKEAALGVEEGGIQSAEALMLARYFMYSQVYFHQIRRIYDTHARRIVLREHFKVLYERNPDDVKINPEAGKSVFEALSTEFGQEHFRHDRYHQSTGAPDFPVRMRDGQIVSSLAVSDTLNRVPIVSVDYVFAERSIVSKASAWLRKHRADIVKPREEEGDNG